VHVTAGFRSILDVHIPKLFDLVDDTCFNLDRILVVPNPKNGVGHEELEAAFRVRQPIGEVRAHDFENRRLVVATARAPVAVA
jgi:hypothetical protein